MNIYVATQKSVEVPYKDVYCPIIVGSVLKGDCDELGYLKDDTGDSISERNPFYCELTALYWAWKNTSDDIIGLVHYRRFLSLKKKQKNINDILSKKETENILQKYDIILPRKICLYGTVRNQYGTGQFIKDYDLAGDIIKRLYPDYYKDFEIVSNSDEIYICNMFISSKRLIDKYCEWIFPILFEVENSIKIEDYKSNQKRVLGYLSERLFNVWIIHNNLKIKEVYLYNTEERFINRLRRNYHLIEYRVLGKDVLGRSYKNRIKRDRRK